MSLSNEEVQAACEADKARSGKVAVIGGGRSFGKNSALRAMAAIAKISAGQIRQRETATPDGGQTMLGQLRNSMSASQKDRAKCWLDGEEVVAWAPDGTPITRPRPGFVPVPNYLAWILNYLIGNGVLKPSDLKGRK